eukprot:scaffold150553_cov37-Attheya_sp.AAC.1
MVEEANCNHSKMRPQLCTERKNHPRVPFETSQVKSGDSEVSGTKDTQRVRSRLSKQFKIPCTDGALRSYFPVLAGKKSLQYHPGRTYSSLSRLHVAYEELIAQNCRMMVSRVYWKRCIGIRIGIGIGF